MRELRVEVSGEGDFSMETTSAWDVEVRLGAHVVYVRTADFTEEDGGIHVHAERWDERGGIKLGAAFINTARLDDLGGTA